jgi:hypothetical protein
MRFVPWLVATLTLCLLFGDELNGHRIRLDSSGKLISWVEPADRAYEEVIRRAWQFLREDVPVEANGLKTYFSYCCMKLETLHNADSGIMPRRTSATRSRGTFQRSSSA